MSSPNRRISLSLPQTWLLVWSAILLMPIHLGLMWLGYERLRAFGERLTPLPEVQLPPANAEDFRRAKDIGRVVSIAARRGVFKAGCLRRSMLVWWFLRKRGFRSDICFGVRRNGAQLEAHAWVERDGVVLDDTEEIRARYRVLREVLPADAPGL